MYLNYVSINLSKRRWERRYDKKYHPLGKRTFAAKRSQKKGVELAVKVRLGFCFVFVWSRRAKGQHACMLVRAPHIQPLQKQAARGEGVHSWKRRSAKAARLSRGREQSSRARGEGRGTCSQLLWTDADSFRRLPCGKEPEPPQSWEEG